MVVIWSKEQDQLHKRNGESPFVPKDFLDGSNFQRLYQGHGEPRRVSAKGLAESFTCAVNAFVQHYWTCREDFEITADHQVEGSGHLALDEMSPKWHDDLVDHYGVGTDPEAVMKLYTSATMVVVRRVFKNCSLEPDGTVYPPGAELPSGLQPGHLGRPMALASTDEVGQATRMLFRLFQCPENIPGVNYDEFIQSDIAAWTGRKPVHFFERKPFYRALNCALSQDAPNVLKALMGIIMDMNFFINSSKHKGGVFYSGVGLGESMDIVKVGAKLRMPRFLSTTTEIRFAKSRIADKVGAALLVVRVPEGFWGAKSIKSFSSCPEEEETIFCAHALFEVERISSFKVQGKEVARIDLIALDKYDAIQYEPSAYPGGVPTDLQVESAEADATLSHRHLEEDQE
mmetsp:Transcript_10139/g.22449  ORF Transcript_10139/g.22449 Transcript_10139/m.22449 type:complete len:401 (+) Transcript_10139:212-1414(+)